MAADPEAVLPSVVGQEPAGGGASRNCGVVRMSPRQLTTGAGLLALLATTPAGAEPIRTEGILVSAGRRPVAADATGRAYSVITAEEIERRQIRYAGDALRALPGVSVTRNGGFGGVTAVRIRGMDDDKTLVLVDGVEVAAVGDGSFDFGGLLARDIARIEVLRGPQSALYGSNAAGGVISIITKPGARGTAEAGLTVEGGSDYTRALSGFVRGGGESWDLAFSASARQTDGFDISTDGDGEEDGDQNLTANLKGNWDVSPDLRLGATARLTDRKSDFDAFSAGRTVDADNVTEQTAIFTSTFLRHEAFDDRLVNELRFEYTDVTRTSNEGGFETFQSEGHRLHVSGQSSLSFETPSLAATHVVTGALEYEREVNIAQTRDFSVFPPPVTSADEQTRDLVGVIGEWRATILGDLDLQAGVRQDFNDAFEDAFTYSVGVSYTVPGTGARVHSTVGKGVVNPSFVEQFGFFPGSFIGNPDLEPEQTFGWDIGVEQTLLDGRLILDATYFRASVTDQIVPGFDAGAGLPTSVNDTGESDRQGVELMLSANPLPELTLDASYTYTLSQDPDGLSEVRVPRHAGKLSGTYAFLGGRGSVTTAVTYNGDRRDLDFSGFPAGRVLLDDYVRLDVSGEYALTDSASLFARVENATDAQYEEVFNFSTQDITGFAGVRVTF